MGDRSLTSGPVKREVFVRINIKIVVAAISWTAAIGAALGRTFSGTPALTVWSVLAAVLAATATAGLIVDYVARSTARYIISEARDERAATVTATVEEIHKYGEPTADRIVERLVSKQDKTLERMAAEIADALRNGDRQAPTPIR